MAGNQFNEGVRPGGLTTATEMRILLCYLIDNVQQPVSREEIENVLVGEELANYFLLAESLGHLVEQGLATAEEGGYRITPAGREVAHTLGHEVPRTVREAAAKGVIRAQEFAARQAVHRCKITPLENGKGRKVHCAIEDEAGTLFCMELFLPDDLTAKTAQQQFTNRGDVVFKLLLAALTDNRTLAQRALDELEEEQDH